MWRNVCSFITPPHFQTHWVTEGGISAISSLPNGQTGVKVEPCKKKRKKKGLQHWGFQYYSCYGSACLYFPARPGLVHSGGALIDSLCVCIPTPCQLHVMHNGEIVPVAAQTTAAGGCPIRALNRWLDGRYRTQLIVAAADEIKKFVVSVIAEVEIQNIRFLMIFDVYWSI